MNIHSTRRPLLVFLSLLVGTLSYCPPVFACAVCFSAKNEASRTAFIVTTAGMTILPLLLIGWAVRWVVRRERESNAEDPILLQADEEEHLPGVLNTSASGVSQS